MFKGLPSHAVSSSVLLEVMRAASSACVLLEGTCVPTQTPACHLNFSATRGAHTCRTQNFELECKFLEAKRNCSNPKTLEHVKKNACCLV